MASCSSEKPCVVNWERDIHKFKLNDMLILLDVNSGSVHILDETAWDVLEALERHQGDLVRAQEELKNVYSPAAVGEVVEELLRLKEEGLLFTSDREVQEWVGRPRDYAVKSLCLNVAHGCNMRCGYCFASDISFGDNSELMSFEVGQKALDFLLKQSGSRKHLEVDYFGGEPLLNLNTVKQLTRYGAETAARMGKQIKFTITTNCLLIDDDFIDFVNEYDMQVVLSLDGRKEVHDSVRRLAGGGNSYDTILPRMQKLVSQRNHENYYVRGTYTRNNMDFSKDVLHLFDLGFRHVSLEPVVAPPETYGFAEKDVPVLAREYERLSAELQKRREAGQFVDFFHFNVDLEGGTCIPKRIKGCGAGFEYLAVAPDGTFFPCHQYDGRNEFAMGEDINDIADTDISEKFASAHIYNKKDCKNCWARFLCSGGCHASAYEFSGTLTRPYTIGCLLQKKRLECGIWFQLKKEN